MDNTRKIVRWLIEHQEEALIIATTAVKPLLLDEAGDWIGETDFPSGADYIDHVLDVVESTGLLRYTDKLQENGKTY